MNRHTLRRILTLTAVAALLATGVAWAGPGGGKPGDAGAWLADFLDLTPAQEAAWETARADHQEAIEPTIVLVSETRQQLREALEARDDLSLIAQLTAEMATLRAELRGAREELQDELSSVLDADQQILWEALQQLGGPRGRRPRGDQE